MHYYNPHKSKYFSVSIIIYLSLQHPDCQSNFILLLCLPMCFYFSQCFFVCVVFVFVVVVFVGLVVVGVGVRIRFSF